MEPRPVTSRRLHCLSVGLLKSPLVRSRICRWGAAQWCFASKVATARGRSRRRARTWQLSLRSRPAWNGCCPKATGRTLQDDQAAAVLHGQGGNWPPGRGCGLRLRRLPLAGESGAPASAHGARAVRTRTEPCLLHKLSAYRRACGALLDPVIPISQSLAGEGASSRDLVPLAHDSSTWC